MIILVNDQLFFPGAAHEVDRLALLRNAARRQHTLRISPFPVKDIEQGPIHSKNSENYRQWLSTLQGELLKEVTLLSEQLKQVSAMAITRGSPWLLVSNDPADRSIDGCWLTLEQAVRAVGAPLFVLVENMINDAAFFRTVMPPPWKQRLKEWEELGMLRFEHGGGQSIVDIVKKFSDDKYSAKAFGLPAEAWKALHFVICDHDGKCAKEPGKLARDAQDACNKAQMMHRLHRLERKKQENYIPQEAADELAKRHSNAKEFVSKIADFDRLPEDERHFVDFPLPSMKNCFDNEFSWLDEWFLTDGSWPEMARLAEKIAAAM
jgi:hypothetical protein